jgi:hypothetical protein
MSINPFDSESDPSSGVITWLFENHPFFDLGSDSSEQIDVIIPLLHSNQLWEQNLKTYYREIPIGKLIVGDAGCIDGSLEVLKNFPRVEILDHRKIATLGKSLALMIKEVTTPEFAYLQSDVALPPGWLSRMREDLLKYQWVGSPMHLCVLADYRNDFRAVRPLAGAQLGKAAAFSGFEEYIDDDYVYRQEDFVLANFVIEKGFKVGNSSQTYHLHQFMHRITTGEENKIKSINVEVSSSASEMRRVTESQMKGMLKYTSPSYDLAKNEVIRIVRHTLASNPNLLITFLAFAKSDAPQWVSVLKKSAVRESITVLYVGTKTLLSALGFRKIQLLLRIIFL